jgi:putative toxin-antitoxin system antitoxin component (TIGR02293 family)
METKTDPLILKNEKLSTAGPSPRSKLKKSKRTGESNFLRPRKPRFFAGISIEQRRLLLDYIEKASIAAALRKTQKIKYRKFSKMFEGKLTDQEVATTIYAQKRSSVATVKAKTFDSLETDRANRLARLVELSERVFGDTEKSSRWLRKPRTNLSGQTALELIATDAGAAIVEEMLHRIDHGMYA